jgi:hypothetical protein
VVHGDTHGVIAGDVDVPDYKKAPFVVSQPLVVASGTAAIPIRREDYEPFKAQLSAAPTAQREFSLTESVEVYLEVHMPARRGTARTPDPVPAVRAALLNVDRARVAEASIRVGPSSRGLAGAFVLPLTVTPRFAGLQAGMYELDITVGTDPYPAVMRRVAFTLR